MSDELRINIQSLHDALADAPVDECTAGTLKQITEDIHIAVAQAEGKIPVQSFNDQLEQEAIRFSEDHPSLTQAIRQVMVTLSSMGI
ncbi:DUF4404 family protein [Endozoicomonas ascidiicola]|uniref:DUF4404 family protein n=1 Tax=Endozoicomonas ascidiicola TaxID=1698521 RepID=UPI00083299E1|nr:DUF4404 family protein [Endozoicomonas ascidiicola]